MGRREKGRSGEDYVRRGKGEKKGREMEGTRWRGREEGEKMIYKGKEKGRVGDIWSGREKWRRLRFEGRRREG